MSGEYDDIIAMPRYVSPTRRKMSNAERAAQFSPFAALTGYDAAVRETARLTDARGELDESEVALLDEKLQILAHNPTWASITYFRPDGRKAGGAYLTACGMVKKVDAFRGQVVMEDGLSIPIEEIFGIVL